MRIWPSARKLWLVGSVSMALTLGMLGAPDQPAVAVPSAIVEDDLPIERPDRISAMVTAQATGKRVEDLSQRDGYSRSYANPDGSWTLDTSTDPREVLDSAGEWHDVDVTLVERDGTVAPRYAATDLELSAGGDKTFAALAEGGHDLAWRWPTVLPEPVLDGNTATYVGAADGGDLVVTATATGFTHSVVLHEAPDGPVAYTMPVVTDGAELVETSNGGLEISADQPGGDEATLVAAPQPTMWDSSVADDDPNGHTHLPVATELGETANGTQTLTLVPDEDFLADPSTVYPVTVDPSFTSVATGDTFVSVNNPTSQHTVADLRVGNPDGGSNKARTFLRFNDIVGKIGSNRTVQSASLVMYNWESNDCNSSPINVAQINQSWGINSLTWSGQPSVSGRFNVDYNPAKGGGTACPAGNATWDVTGILRDWVNGTTDNWGLRVKAANEGVARSWRRYRATESSATSNHPRLVINYNTFPGTASIASITPTTSYAPPGGAAAVYTSSLRPVVTGRAPDGDGGTVRVRFEARAAASASSTLLAACADPKYVAQNSNTSCPLPTLPDNTTVYIRAKGYDSAGGWGGGSLDAAAGWSAWKTVRVAATNPSAPVISCPTPYASNTWHDNAPTSDLACTITATGTGTNAPGAIRWSRDGGGDIRSLITPSSSVTVARINVTVPRSLGAHSIVARAESASGRTSVPTTYGVGYGPLTITIPKPRASGRSSLTTAGPVAIRAEGPATTVTSLQPTVRWRIAGSGASASSGWATADAPDLNVVNAGNTSVVTGTVDVNTFNGIDANRSTLIELQLCVPYPGTTTCTWSASPLTVLKVPNAFGGALPTASAGLGTVSLVTGELMINETDVDESGYNTGLSISRTYLSQGTLDGEDSIFGPGWSATLAGPGTGHSGSQLIDDSLIDGTIKLIDGTGGVLAWARQLPVARRLSGSGLQSGEWHPVDDATRLSAIGLNLESVGSDLKATVTTPDATRTVFSSASSGQAGAATFKPTSVSESGQQVPTIYETNQDGQTVSIRSTVRDQAACSADGPIAVGCKALKLTYGSSGSSEGRLTNVSWSNGPAEIDVVSYQYDTAGRLSVVTNVRSGLSSTYVYVGTSSRIFSIQQATMRAYRFTYDESGRLGDVARDRATGAGSEKLGSFRYDIPLASTSGLPDLSSATVSSWGQETPPVYGAASFSASAPSLPQSVGDITNEQWKWASLVYTDQRGRTINTSEFGANRWLMTSSTFDEFDNLVREIGASDIAALQDGNLSYTNAGTIYVYDAVENDLGEVTIPAGSVMTESFGPARFAVVNELGESELVRPHTTTIYDEGAPDDGVNPETETAFGLPTRTVTRAWSVAGGADLPESSYTHTETRNGYEPVSVGDVTGWSLGLPTTSTIEMGGNESDITTKTRYDRDGRPVEIRQPKSNGSDAGSRRIIYYGGGVNQAAPECGDNPAWAGEICKIEYAGPSADGALPVTWYSSYDSNLQPLEIVESVSGQTRRRVTNTYDSAGRIATTQTKTVGLSGSTSINGQSITYSETTGLPISTHALNAAGDTVGDPITFEYDAWGRKVSYAPAPGEVTTTSYDSSGQVETITDPRGTTTYRYDGATATGGVGNDADGNLERRGLLTSVVTSRPGSADVVFDAAYDPNGSIVTQLLPGGIVQRNAFGSAGELTASGYSGQVTSLDQNGDPVVSADAVWFGWAVESDVFGRVVRESTPEGAGYNAELAAGAGTGYSRAFSYDRAGRLARAIDRVTPAGSGPIDGSASDSVPAGSICQTRNYGFDANGNRTSLTKRGANPNGSCSSAVAETKSWSHDAADRIRNGYSYDELGRVTSLPASDSPLGSGASNVVLSYHDNDAVRSISQNGTTSTYSLDAAGRRQVEATGPSGGGATTTVVSHFTDGSDNPTWTQRTSAGSTITSRYLGSVGGDLTATLVSSGVSTAAASSLTLPLTNYRSDVVTTVSVPISGAATGVGNWSTYDEYGNTPSAVVANPQLKAATGLGYGWAGGKQRAISGAGLILMGARVYNPVSGSFTSVDPVFGGNTTAYAYPQDPINDSDFTGQFSKKTWRKIAGVLGKAAAVAGIVPFCGPCDVAAAVLTMGQVVSLVKGGRGMAAVKAVVTLIGQSSLGEIRKAIGKAIGKLDKPIKAVMGNRQGRDMTNEIKAWLTGGKIFTYLAEKYPDYAEILT